MEFGEEKEWSALLHLAVFVSLSGDGSGRGRYTVKRLFTFLAPGLCLTFKIALSWLSCGRNRLFPHFLIMTLGSDITLTALKATVWPQRRPGLDNSAPSQVHSHGEVTPAAALASCIPWGWTFGARITLQSYLVALLLDGRECFQCIVTVIITIARVYWALTVFQSLSCSL